LLLLKRRETYQNVDSLQKSQIALFEVKLGKTVRLYETALYIVILLDIVAFEYSLQMT